MTRNSDLIHRARVAQHSILPQPELIKELADEVERLTGIIAEGVLDLRPLDRLQWKKTASEAITSGDGK